MGFFNYDAAIRKFRENETMLETIQRIGMFDEFHCLRDSSLLTARKAAEWMPRANAGYLSWLSVCNGGLMFDTTLLSVFGMDNSLEVEFSTLEEYNNRESYQEFGLPEGYYVIALRSYGDPICLSAEDDRVYLWDCEEGDFTTIWNSFCDFLTDEVDTAIELIADDSLEPIPLKMIGGDDE